VLDRQGDVRVPRANYTMGVPPDRERTGSAAAAPGQALPMRTPAAKTRPPPTITWRAESQKFILKKW